jgi:phosphohistidine phosphatase
MTKRLILIRHSKSSWDDPQLTDHQRTLNKRGKRSATAVGKWLAEHEYSAEIVLCSTAARAQETAQLVLAEQVVIPQVSLLKSLYLAAPDTMLNAIRGAESDHIMLVGHNPGCAMFATALAANAPTHARFSDYPTAATTIIEFSASHWADIEWGQGQVIDFIVPRDIGVD